MKRLVVLVMVALFLAACDNTLYEAYPLTFKFQFINFNTVANGQVGFLAGGFPVGGWSVSAYPLTWSNGDSNVVTISGFLDLKKILFRIVKGGTGSDNWDPPAGINYNLLKPNAWDTHFTNDDYVSSDSNWAVGNGDEGNGIVKPAGGFVPNGSTHEIVIDGRGGNQQSWVYIDNVLKFSGQY